MIPILGAMQPEAPMPFATIAGAAVSGAKTVSVALPTWVRNVGRYSLLVQIYGSWGGSAERAGLDVLNSAASPIISLTEITSISGSYVTASEGYYDGSSWNILDPTTSWRGGSIGGHTQLILFEGITGAASVQLRSVAGAPGNPTYFGPWSVTGLGRGRRDPRNWAALKAGLNTNGDGYVRIICS